MNLITSLSLSRGESPHLMKCGARGSLRTLSLLPSPPSMATEGFIRYICVPHYMAHRAPSNPVHSSVLILAPNPCRWETMARQKLDSSPGHIVVEARLLPPSPVFCSLHTGPHFPMDMWGTTVLAAPQPAPLLTETGK